MKMATQSEINMVVGGSCLCRCRQYHAENGTMPGWYMLNGKNYEDIVVGVAKELPECLGICKDMLEGNLFKTCLTLVEKEVKEKGQKRTVFAEREIKNDL